MIADLAKGFAAKPSDSLQGVRLAIYQAWFGQNEAYASTCQKLLERADQATTDLSARERAVKAWCLRASTDLALQKRVLELAKKQVGKETESWQRKWNSQALGMAEFRAGNLPAAETALLQAEQQAAEDTKDAQYLPFIQGSCRFFPRHDPF